MSRPESGNSLYRLIELTIKERILSGIYRPGDRIPSIRKAANEFGCNKLTVTRAFDRLAKQGLIEKLPGSGSYVKYPEKIRETADLFDFKTDYPSESFFPHQTARRLFDKIFEKEGEKALMPPPAAGDPGLISLLAEHYRLPAERMLIISGAQQGLDLVAKVFSGQIPGSVLFEDPTYPGAISLFKARHFVRLDPSGPDIQDMKQKLTPGIRLFYSMPAVHNPLGTGYSEDKKEAVAGLARRHPFFIIEDDYLGELRGNTFLRFFDLCPDRTIYIKSLSQTMGAGIRLGFMVVPGELKERFIYSKFSTDISSFGLLQKFVREFFQEGHFSPFLDACSKRAAARRRVLMETVGRFDFLSVSGDQQGYSLWVKSRLPVKVEHVPWLPGREFSFSRQFHSCMRISFMNMDDSTFAQGISYIKRLIESIPGRI